MAPNSLTSQLAFYLNLSLLLLFALTLLLTYPTYTSTFPKIGLITVSIYLILLFLRTVNILLIIVLSDPALAYLIAQIISPLIQHASLATTYFFIFLLQEVKVSLKSASWEMCEKGLNQLRKFKYVIYSLFGFLSCGIIISNWYRETVRYLD